MRTVTTKTEKTIVQKDHDRIVFLWYENELLIGINYHQGVDAIDKVFLNYDEEIMCMYRIAHRHKSELSDIELVDLAIDMHQDAWMRFDRKTLTIDTYSKGLIKDALQYYIASMRSFFGSPKGVDVDEAIGEFRELSKLMNYDMTITMRLEELSGIIDLRKYEKK